MDALGGTEELNKIAQLLYPIVRINQAQDGDLLTFGFILRNIFTSLGYRKLSEIPDCEKCLYKDRYIPDKMYDSDFERP